MVTHHLHLCILESLMVYHETCYYSFWTKKSPVFLMFNFKFLNCNILKNKYLSRELNFLLSLLPKVNDLVVILNYLTKQILNEYLLVPGIVPYSWRACRLANAWKGNQWISKKMEMRCLEGREKPPKYRK